MPSCGSNPRLAGEPSRLLHAFGPRVGTGAHQPAAHVHSYRVRGLPAAAVPVGGTPSPPPPPPPPPPPSPSPSPSPRHHRTLRLRGPTCPACAPAPQFHLTNRRPPTCGTRARPPSPRASSRRDRSLRLHHPRASPPAGAHLFCFVSTRPLWSVRSERCRCCATCPRTSCRCGPRAASPASLFARPPVPSKS